MNKKHIIEAIALALIVTSLFIVWINLTLKEKKVYIKHAKPYEEFGIETSHDEYVDNMEKGKYTSHGRLITTEK